MKFNKFLSPWVVSTFVLLVSFALVTPVTAETPHIIYGKVFNQAGGVPSGNDLDIYAYIPTRPGEVLDKTSVGSGYGIFSSEGWLWFEAGRYSTPWSINENLRVIVIDTQLNESGVVDLVLNRTGNQFLSDLHLVSGDNVGPVIHDSLVDGSNLTSVPEGTANITLTAAVDDAIAGNNNIQGGEYFIDTDPGFGSGIGMSPDDGIFDSPNEGVSVLIDTSSWTEGSTYTIYARGQDTANNWGTTQIVVVSVTEPVGGMRGDLDNDGDVDRDDLNIILAARNTPAAGPDDPRDLDGDGMITGLDSRILVTLCTRSRCATQ